MDVCHETCRVHDLAGGLSGTPKNVWARGMALEPRVPRLGKAVLKNLLLGIIAAEFRIARDRMKQAACSARGHGFLQWGVAGWGMVDWWAGGFGGLKFDEFQAGMPQGGQCVTQFNDLFHLPDGHFQNMRALLQACFTGSSLATHPCLAQAGHIYP